jgi:hypothetical protein
MLYKVLNDVAKPLPNGHCLIKNDPEEEFGHGPATIDGRFHPT